MAPKLSVKLGVRVNGDVIDFFHKMSLDIINAKRDEIQSRGSIAKPTNFIELLLEAEHNAQIEQTNGTDDEVKKSEKCKLGECV